MNKLKCLIDFGILLNLKKDTGKILSSLNTLKIIHLL